MNAQQLRQHKRIYRGGWWFANRSRSRYAKLAGKAENVVFAGHGESRLVRGIGTIQQSIRTSQI